MVNNVKGLNLKGMSPEIAEAFLEGYKIGKDAKEGNGVVSVGTNAKESHILRAVFSGIESGLKLY